MLHQCSESCGWMSGILAALAFGTFGVPIRSTSHLNIDPLVMQTYKTTVCFLTCWFVVLLGEPIRFTPWGIVSGMFWVPGATAGIYGIRNAGLAISAGSWSAIIVLTSFCWGIFVFEEEVKSVGGACFATLVLIIGLVGMAVFSEPPPKKAKLAMELSRPLILKKDSNEMEAPKEEFLPTQESTVTKRRMHTDFPSNDNIVDIETEDVKLLRSTDSDDSSDTEPRKDPIAIGFTSAEEHELEKDGDGVLCFGILLNRRQLGIIGAIINGAWGGNSVIPMHYAKAQGFDGAGYLISYSCGSMIVTIALWFLRFLYNLYRTEGDAKLAYDSLPSSHIRKMWLPGFLAGGLYSLGNFFALMTVSVLGQGVGYSFIQTSMLVSGLWGIFYFSEIKGTIVIVKWMLSSLITVIGIMGLSYEHLSKAIPEKLA